MDAVRIWLVQSLLVVGTVTQDRRSPFDDDTLTWKRQMYWEVAIMHMILSEIYGCALIPLIGRCGCGGGFKSLGIRCQSGNDTQKLHRMRKTDVRNVGLRELVSCCYVFKPDIKG